MSKFKVGDRVKVNGLNGFFYDGYHGIIIVVQELSYVVKISHNSFSKRVGFDITLRVGENCIVSDKNWYRELRLNKILGDE